MPSIINYRFVSMKNFSKITFEGTSLQGWELKSEITLQKQMHSDDFDLILYEQDLTTEITDDTVIYKNSSVIVKRVPAWMSKSKPKEKATIKQRRNLRAPPINYVCFRCGQKNHFIQHCPTNSDKNYDIVRIRKPTGIPRAFLVPTEGDTADSARLVTPSGGYVQVQPQVQEWERLKTGVLPVAPMHFFCSECNLVLREPMLANCGHCYCRQCCVAGDVCVVCSKLVTNLKENRELEEEISNFYT